MVVVRKKGMMQGCVGRFEIKDCQHSLFAGKGAPGFECHVATVGSSELVEADVELHLKP